TIIDQVWPPSVDCISPARFPPAGLLLPAAFRLLKRPIPAIILLKLASVRSNCKAPIESDGSLSVSGVHVGPLGPSALVVSQMPPLTVPTNSVLPVGSAGSTSTVSMPPLSGFGMAPGPVMFDSSPSEMGAGPWADHSGVLSGTCEASPSSRTAIDVLPLAKFAAEATIVTFTGCCRRTLSSTASIGNVTDN